MERLEFVAEAKKRGYKDSDIQERLALYDQFVREGYPMDFDSFFGAIEPDEIDIFRAELPAQAMPA